MKSGTAETATILPRLPQSLAAELLNDRIVGALANLGYKVCDRAPLAEATPVWDNSPSFY